MLWLLLLVGVVLLAVMCLDVYATVFVPTGQPGPVAGRLYHLTWRLWHRRFGDGSARSRRQLAQLGPLLVPFTVLVWAALLWLGFTLVFLPWFPAESGFPGWFTALYVSGYSVTTLGTGDITPSGRWPRALMVLAAASGFVLISVAVTYLLSVYGALARMTALAFEIHRFVGRDDGLVPADVLVTVARADAASELSDWLASTASSLAEVVQADDEFPLLHYFHFPDERALPVALSDLLEVVTLCRTVLSPAAFPALTGGLVIAGTERIARSYFTALVRKFEGQPVDGERLMQERRAAFDTAWQTLSLAGVPLRAREEAWARYDWERRTWDEASARLRAGFGYPAFENGGPHPEAREGSSAFPRSR